MNNPLCHKIWIHFAHVLIARIPHCESKFCKRHWQYF